MRWSIGVALAAVVLCGCDDEPAEGGDPIVIPMAEMGIDPDMGPDMALDPDMAIEADMALEPDMAPMPMGDVCDQLGLARRDFISDGPGLKFGDRAGDFTLATLDGPWTLSEQWTGCESYVFITYFPDFRADPSGPWYGDQLFESPIERLVVEGPRNVQYFITSYEDDRVDRDARLMALRDRLADRVEELHGEAEAAFWTTRFHFVTDRLLEGPGSVGDFFTAYFRYAFNPDSRVDLGDRGQAPPPLPQAFAINRGQRWDPVGSLSEYVGSPPVFAMAGYAGHYYNYHAELAERVRAEADTTTIVPILGGLSSDRIFIETVTLPDAEAMAAFDTFEFDVGVTCPHQNPFGCSEWDRIAHIEWCADPDCEERLEVVRWITPYWRRGHRRWIIDASAFRPLMLAGGEQTFRVSLGPGWERATERDIQVSLRLRTLGADAINQDVQRAFTGGDFGAEYNDRDPFIFTPPAGATRGELVVIVSGHGQTEGDNCAEWCDHRHHFTLNGTELDAVRSGPGIGDLRTCAVRAVDGVPPGQWGNWAIGRAYWCPGLPVDAMRIDLTELMEPGVENTLDYRASFMGGDPRGGNISLNVYVAWGTD